MATKGQAPTTVLLLLLAIGCGVCSALIRDLSGTATITATNTRLEGKRCETIQVPMCKGQLRHNATLLPNRFGHRTQAEVYWALQPWWPFIDAGCSNNLRSFLCGLFLPRCDGDGREPLYPCAETCRKAKVRCAKHMRRHFMRWVPAFQCHRFLPKSSKRCIRPHRERKKNKNRQYQLCVDNPLPMCQGIPFSKGSLPNMFLQGDESEIETEMAQFQPLVDSGCSRKLRLFMCGAYMPFCVPDDGSNEAAGKDRRKRRKKRRMKRRMKRRNKREAKDDDEEEEDDDEEGEEEEEEKDPKQPFLLPCRELCQEVYDNCYGEYQQRTNGLPWPAKFQCHRFPSYVDQYNNDRSRRNSRNITVRNPSPRRKKVPPCTMPPYNYDGH